MKLKELANILGAQGSCPEDVEITGASGVRDAGGGQITFIAGLQNLKDLEGSRAAAALVPLDTPVMHLPLVRVKNPRLAFARVLEIFYVKPYCSSGISDKTVIGRDVVLGSDLSLHPCAVVADGAKIGDRVTLYPGVYVGSGSIIGDDSVIYPNVSIGERVTIGQRVIIHAGTEIGSDGFGFVTEGGRHHKIPQVGGVIIEDDVEIGGNCSIDRATLGNTIIKKGTKLDNQVHVAHNVTIGEHCLVAGQAGIAGSSTLGNYVVFGGQAGVADHTTVGDRVMAGGKAVITKDVEAGQIIAGFNAMPLRTWLKVQAILPKLPELKKNIAELQKQVEDLKARASDT
ncbi:MAG: UDP-3-O-(3-hydroxymyristoyl)glucosamine N-acyltransferase [Nitrospiraceae bacterium]|nr:UDP-3-O-(3-hydroxymyristoyl)glucosamine N-acyltransferase [Nitrospiraceae bacterium]